MRSSIERVGGAIRCLVVVIEGKDLARMVVGETGLRFDLREAPEAVSTWRANLTGRLGFAG